MARDLARVDAQITRLVDAVAMGGAEVRAVVDRLRALEQRRTDLWAERDRLHATSYRVAPTAGDLDDLEADILACLADRRELCRQHPVEARRLLNSVLVQRMVWTPHGAGRDASVTFTATCALDRLVTGVLAGGPDDGTPHGAPND